MSLNPVDFVRRCFSLVLVLPFPRFSPSVQNLPFGTQTRATFDRPRERDLRIANQIIDDSTRPACNFTLRSRTPFTI